MYRHLRVKSSVGRSHKALAIALPDTSPARPSLPAGYQSLDERTHGAISAAIARPEFSAARGSVTAVYPDRHYDRLYILGLGKAKDAGIFQTGEALRVAGSRLLKMAYAANIHSLEIQLTPGLVDTTDPALAGRALGDGLAIASFDFDTYKGKASTPGKGPSQGSAASNSSGGTSGGAAGGKPTTLDITADQAISAHLARALKIGQSVNIARQLAATPPNVANPGYLVKYCRSMATKTGLRCTIIDRKQAAKLGMGGLLAVGAAGSSPPAIIKLEHQPTSAKAKKAQPVLLVGKAVTFDTGGYSIKPAASMEGMKYDKCGGMAVIGAMHAIASLKLDVPVIGLIPTAENMVSDKAYRPNDIVTFCNGVTSEITNTDAEGRLILADALAYGTASLKPQAVIDLATLTGGVVVALGTQMAGLFCNNTALRDQLSASGLFAGERLWELPLWDEHRQMMKGVHSDLINSSPLREASPIQGAAFLSYFIEPDGKTQLPTVPWAHLDIAGVADVKGEKGAYSTGPTGYGVRLLVHALENWKPARPV
jgi:leucyl aminopeptidase